MNTNLHINSNRQSTLLTACFSIALLFPTLGFSQKAISNEISGELRIGAGLLNSRVQNTPTEFKSVTMPALTLYYTPQLYKSLELQVGLGADARGGKTTTPSAKYRSYNANALLGMRVKMKDFKFGAGINPTYFLDTRKTILEGSLSSGVVHIPVKHFVKTDFPIYASAELKIHELFSVELRYSRSLSAFTGKTFPTFRTFSLTANYLLGTRYKRVKVAADKQ